MITFYKDIIIDNDSPDKDNFSEMHIGKYGEDLLFSKHPDGTYIFSSFVLNLWDIYLPEISKIRIINTYCNKGVLGFDIKNITQSFRIDKLGQALRKVYNLYEVSKDEHLYYLMWEIILNAEKFKLTRTKYIDWFITFGGAEDWDYISYILELKKRVLRSKIYHWKIKIDYDSKEDVKISVHHIYAPSKKEAILSIKNKREDIIIKSIENKGLVSDAEILFKYYGKK